MDFFLKIDFDTQNQDEIQGLTAEQGFRYKMSGDVFNDDVSIYQIYNAYKKNDKIQLSGEFNIVFDDPQSVIVLNDELGCIKWFYFFDDKRFVLSNDFWKVANAIDADVSNIRKEALYEILLLGLPLESKTWIDGINVFPRGGIAKLDKSMRTLEFEELYPIDYSETLNDEAQAMVEVDEAFHKSIQKIEEHNQEKTFLFSTSGGLDSRFPLIYTRHLKKKSSFLIGRNDGVGKAFDYRNASLLTKKYGLDLLLVDPFSQSLEEKVKLDLKRNPLGHSNILKALDVRAFIKKPEDTVLITGAHGGLIGGRVLNQDLISSKTDKELARKILFYYGAVRYFNQLESHKTAVTQNRYIRKFKTLGKLLRGDDLAVKQTSSLDEIEFFLQKDFLIPREYRAQILLNLEHYVESNQGTVLTKVMRYHLLRHAITGMFESLLGQVKSYTIYTCYIYQSSKKWTLSFLKDRSLMETFLKNKDHYSSKLSLQKYKASNSVFLGFFYNIYRFLSFRYRKLAIHYSSWWEQPRVKVFVENSLKTESSFYNFFPRGEVEKLMNQGGYSQTKETLVKLKLMIEYLENKRFLDEDLDSFPFSSKY